MRHYAALLLAVLGAGCLQDAATQYYDEILYSNNGRPWVGEYGDMDFCPDSSSNNATFTFALDFKYDDLDDLDFIAGDSVKLYCRDEDGVISGYVSSLEGSHGEWQGIRSCPANEYFTGFRLRVYPEQGTFGDDFAVDNIQLACSDGTVVDGLDGVTPPAPYLDNPGKGADDEAAVVRKWVEIKGRWAEVVRQRSGAETKLNGQWGTWAYCSPGLTVMGIQTFVDEGDIGDDSGLTDVRLFCA
ncbi:vitelline membrane outer layer protein 1 homolog isoform X3 [Eriocheir sinensis]|nr:vitelline membrane outer layer protein 1 homolog isoform X3 [Eriocheir sinensis]